MRTVVAAIVLVVLSLGSGCITDASRVSENRGNAQNYLRAAQIENPEPLPGRVDGLDPRTTELVLENYAEGQEAQEHLGSQKREPGTFTFGSGRSGRSGR